MYLGVGKHAVLVPEEPRDLRGRGLRTESGKRHHCTAICLNFLSFTKVKNKYGLSGEPMWPF